MLQKRPEHLQNLGHSRDGPPGTAQCMVGTSSLGDTLLLHPAMPTIGVFWSIDELDRLS